jgi:phage baseplate assembly protein gpV
VRAVTVLPAVEIRANGLQLPAEDVQTLTEVRVQQVLSLPAMCELLFLEPRGPLQDLEGLSPGTSLRVSVQGHAEPLFVGEVTAAELAYEASRGLAVRVRGYDLLHRLRKRQPVRVHIQMSLRDLAEELVGGLGLSVQAAEPGPLRQRLFQWRQSDLDLLNETAEQCGLYFSLRGDLLHLMSLEGLDPTLPLSLGDTLFEARIEVNGDPSCRSVSTLGWDPLRVEPHTGEAGQARVGREVSAEVPPGLVGGEEERVLVDVPLQQDQQAEALAQAELDRCVAREVVFWGMAEGDPRLRPGARVELQGVAPSLRGRYVLASVVHTIDARKGFVSELSTAPPVPRSRSRGTMATLGIVSRVDDPDGLGRVQARLSAYGDLETDWMGVITAGAGGKKGLMALPDVGDRVLVLLVHEDPSQGVVLGGLFGEEGLADDLVRRGSIQGYSFLTPGGQRIRLDDARGAVRVQNRGGSYLDLAPGKVVLHCATDLEIRAPGRKVVVGGESIDFQRL